MHRDGHVNKTTIKVHEANVYVFAYVWLKHFLNICHDQNSDKINEMF